MSDIFQTISPVDGSVYIERPFPDNKEIDLKLDLSKSAQKAWQSTSLAVRQDICSKAIDYMLERADQIGEELTWQMGRPLRYTPFEIKGGFQERGKHMISLSNEALEDISVGSNNGIRRYIKKEPLGTVFILAPWNYPYLTAVNALIPALLSGNCVLIKHATQTPLCAERLTEAFEYAGAPSGVVQFLHLTHTQVAQILRDKRINHVCFTGSVNAGAIIEKSIAGRFIGSGLELGGKDPAYVRQDANLEYSIEQLVDGSFFNSGQSCCGIERIYVHKKVFRDFVDGFVQLTNQYVLDNPLSPETTLGPVVRYTAKQSIQRQLKEACAKGAEGLVDRSRFKKAEAHTPYMCPEVLVRVDHSMQIMTEETFGPVIGIMAVESDERAIQLMNDSPYGLTASIWTMDEDRAVFIGNQVDTGTFFMNRCDYLDPGLAWTGVKDSGRGCTLSKLGFDALTRPKSFHLKAL